MESLNSVSVSTFPLPEGLKSVVERIFKEDPDEIRTIFVKHGNAKAYCNALVGILSLYIDGVQNDILGTFIEKFSVEDDGHGILDGGCWNEGSSISSQKDPKKVYGFYIFKKGGAGMEIDGKFYTCKPNDGEYLCMIIRGDIEYQHFLEKDKKKEFIHLVTYTE